MNPDQLASKKPADQDPQFSHGDISRFGMLRVDKNYFRN